MEPTCSISFEVCMYMYIYIEDFIVQFYTATVDHLGLNQGMIECIDTLQASHMHSRTKLETFGKTPINTCK